MSILDVIKSEIGIDSSESKVYKIKAGDHEIQWEMGPLTQDRLALVYTVLHSLEVKGEGYNLLYRAGIVGLATRSLNGEPLSKIFGDNETTSEDMGKSAPAEKGDSSFEFVQWVYENLPASSVSALFAFYKANWPRTLEMVSLERWVCPVCGEIYYKKLEDGRDPAFCVYDKSPLEKEGSDPLD